MDCQATQNPETGAYSVKCGVIKGDDNVNARAGVFAASNTRDGPVTTGYYGAVNADGKHSASLGVTHVPKINMTTVETSARANLYTSPNNNMKLDATVNATRHLSGPWRGKSDMGTGLNFSYKF